LLNIKDFLKSEVVPALGCTEPGAVALAVARARKETNYDKIKQVEALVSANIYKNGYAVGIPGTKGLKGNVIAAALGALCGNCDYGLESLKCCSDSDVEKALQLIKEGCVAVSVDPKRTGIYVKATIITEQHSSECTIEETHTNITKIALDGKTTFLKYENFLKKDSEKKDIPAQIRSMTFRELSQLIDEMDQEDIDYIFKGIEMNMTMAQLGLDSSSNFGLEVGKAVMKLVTANNLPSLLHRVKAYSAAAADARMSGAPLPIMSSAGSGNHGITAILPIYIVADYCNKSRKDTAEAIALSHLTTSFLKSRIGRLSPICGCTVAAGAGAAAGITFLLSKDFHKAERAIEIHLSNLVGMICDGAKETCALKVGTGAYEAFMAALMALQGKDLDVPQGFLGKTLEETAKNLAILSNEGMGHIDSILIELLTKYL